VNRTPTGGGHERVEHGVGDPALDRVGVQDGDASGAVGEGVACRTVSIRPMLILLISQSSRVLPLPVLIPESSGGGSWNHIGHIL